MRHIALTSLAILFTLVFPGQAQGQFSFRRTVGDETENQFQPAIHEATAASGGVISNPNLGASSLNGNFSSRRAFETQLVDFTNHLHSRYLLSFEPQRPHPGLHRIEVRLKQPVPGCRVLARTSYWAAAPPQ